MDRLTEILNQLSANAIEAGKALAGDKASRMDKPLSISSFGNGEFQLKSGAHIFSNRFKTVDEVYEFIKNYE